MFEEKRKEKEEEELEEIRGFASENCRKVYLSFYMCILAQCSSKLDNFFKIELESFVKRKCSE